MPFLKQHRRLLYIISLAVTGFALTMILTMKYGAGASTDGVYYLSAADNFAAGNGIVDFKGNALVLWPPVYPFILGSLGAITGLPSILLGRYLNALLFALTIFAASRLLQRLTNHAISFYLGSLLALVSLPLLALATNIASDPLFILLALLFLLVAQKYLSKPAINNLLLLAAIAGTGALVRWTGTTLVITGTLIMLVSLKANWRRAFTHALLFGSLASLPFALWIVGRNYLNFGTLIGPRNLGDINIWENLLYSYNRFSQWLLPNFVTKRVPLIIFLVAVIAILFWAGRKTQWQTIVKKLFNDARLPLYLFIAVYFIFITVTTFSSDHIDLYDDRYQAPLYIPFALLFFILLETFLFPDDKKAHNRTTSIIVLAVLLWMLYPAGLLYRYATQALDQGIPYYNIYNTGDFRRSDFIQYISNFKFMEEHPLFSNNAAAVYVYTQKQVDNSLNDPRNFIASQDYLAEVGTWPTQGNAYLIWFTPNQKKNYYAPEQLTPVTQLSLLFESEDGALYLVSPTQNQ